MKTISCYIHILHISRETKINIREPQITILLVWFLLDKLSENVIVANVFICSFLKYVQVIKTKEFLLQWTLLISGKLNLKVYF